MFDTTSDAHLLALLHRQADTCLTVVGMSEEDRNRTGPKGAPSPNESGFVNGLLAVLLERECVARGLIIEPALSDLYGAPC